MSIVPVVSYGPAELEFVAIGSRQASAAATVVIVMAGVIHRLAIKKICGRLVRQPEAGQRHSRETNAEFLQRRAPSDRLGQTFR